MKVWDYIFPPEKDVIIWGGGAVGREWLEFLKKLDRRVVCFFDVRADVMDVIDGVRVVLPQRVQTQMPVLLVASYKHAEEIISSARKLGYNNILSGKILDFIPKYVNLGMDGDFFPFGHFYSLYPDLQEVQDSYARVQSASISRADGICLNTEKQIETLNRMNDMWDDLPKWEKYGTNVESKFRYRVGNPSIGMSDSVVLHFMLRLLKPKRFIEVGSGYTSALTLDTAEYYMENNIDLKFIEPYPQLLYSLLKETDDKDKMVIAAKLQTISLDVFRDLHDGDILFIDSSHSVKFGSDVNYLFFHILPHLQKGVYVHLHDIFYPWEYPANWIMKGMGWNELYLLRAFLQYNDSWEIVFFNHYMAREHRDLYCDEWRKISDLGGGSFWMRKK